MIFFESFCKEYVIPKEYTVTLLYKKNYIYHIKMPMVGKLRINGLIRKNKVWLILNRM